MSKKIKVGFVSLGCSKNRIDTEVMLHTLVEAGYEFTGDETEASAKPKSPYICTVSEGGVVINGYIGQETTISLPSHIDGLPVVGIGREAFRSCDLREIVLPDTVKRIDWFAFYQSPMLERVDIPTSVSKIEYGAFDGCDRITVVCERNSYADQYARSFGMKVVNELRH